jgi:site-specific DNA-cytosine methylase
MRAIDLFCGAGGSSLGAAAAGVEIVAGFDIWPVAGSVYRANFPHARFYPCDLAILMESDIWVIRDDLGPVDLLLASPPCTDHSPARGAKPPSSAGLDLPWCVWRFAAVFLPRWIVERAIRTLGRDVAFISVYYGSGPQWQTLDAPLRTVTTRGHFALVRPGRGGHEMRMLQVDELRRAMSFPAWFDFGGCTRTETMRLLGNAVCPPVMQVVVGSLTRGA